MNNILNWLENLVSIDCVIKKHDACFKIHIKPAFAGFCLHQFMKAFSGPVFCLLLGVLSHMPLCILMISGVCVQGMWNAQVKGQVTETHRLKVNSHCDRALFISMYDITMVQP